MAQKTGKDGEKGGGKKPAGQQKRSKETRGKEQRAKEPRARQAGARTAASGRFREVGDNASQVVRQAAAVLEEELAAGIVAGQRIEERFRAERRLDESAVGDVVERFRGTAHELVEVLGERIAELGSAETQDLAERFLSDAQGALDAVANLARFAPEIVNSLAAGQGLGGGEGSEGTRRKSAE